MQWAVSLIYDAKYNGYVAEVPLLPGCMSQGKTVEKALRNVREAIALYLESNPCSERTPARHMLTAFIEVKE